MTAPDLPDAQLALRRKRAAELADEIHRMNLSSEEAAARTGASIQRIHQILAGDADMIPTQHLNDYLTRLTGKPFSSCG